MKPRTKAYFELHIAVLLFGLTAILGRLIIVGEMALVWWRVFFTCLSLIGLPFLINLFRKRPDGNVLDQSDASLSILGEVRMMDRSLLFKYMGIGVIVALHWVCFFGAVNYSNVSITLSCMATVSFMTAILEPIILKSRFKWYELALGLLVIPGMYIILKVTDLNYYQGIIMGLLSAFLAVIFSIYNKKLVNEARPMTITFVELGAGWLFLTLVMPFYWILLKPEGELFWPNLSDLVYLLILAILCTNLAYVFSLKALKHLSAFVTNLTINLEPIYGIILALLIFQENKELGEGFYLGLAIILSSVFVHPILNRYFEGNNLE